MKPRTYETTLAISIAGGGETEIKLRIGYTVSPYIAATQIDPAEGGEVEITCAWLSSGAWTIAAPEWLFDTIEKDAELHDTLRAEWADAEACDRDAATEDRAERARDDATSDAGRAVEGGGL